MERLTLVPNDGSDAGLRGYCTEQDAINRLAAYEDTGLTPDEVDQIRRAAQAMMFETVADFARYAIQNFEDLQKYRKAESEGRLFMPPCRVGDTLYIIIDGKIYEGKVYHISYSNYFGKITASAWTRNGPGASFDDFGKTAFLHRKEAEEKLKERDGA